MSAPLPNSTPGATGTSLNTPSLVLGGLGLLAIGALGAVLLLGNRTPGTEIPLAPAAVVAPAVVPAAAPAEVVPPAAPAPAAVKPHATAQAHGRKPAAEAVPTAPVATAPAPAPAPAVPAEPAPGARAEAAAPAPVAKTVCATCGVVSAVTPVHQKGEAGALGTVAGGVVGGVLGHQVGGGSGKTAMTVIGAVGGAMAGREIEKNQRSTTVYDIRVHMDDGSTRSFTRNEPFAVGQRVTADGDLLAPRSGSGGAGN